MAYTKEIVVGHLHEIKASIQRDVEPVLKAYGMPNLWFDKSVPGFWTIPRLLFPEIDGFAKFRYGISGDAAGKHLVSFMREYFADPAYKQVSGFIYYMFRLGLLHSHYPKEVLIDGNSYAWSTSLGNGGETEIQMLGNNLHLDSDKFYRDFLAAIDKYIAEFDDSKKGKMLIGNFEKAYASMHTAKEVAATRDYISDTDKNFLTSKKTNNFNV